MGTCCPNLLLSTGIWPENSVKFLTSSLFQEFLGYAGKTSLEEATVDALADQMKDYNTEARPYFTALYLKKPEEEIVNYQLLIS